MKQAILLITFLLTLLYFQVGSAQDLDNIGDQPIVSASGGINNQLAFYSASGIENRRPPFFWQTSINLNLDILGVIDLPFSATFAQGSSGFTQPQFAQVGFSPTYKWLTVHAGYRNLTFSEFTLAGTLFLGGGVEVKPEGSPVRVSAMYGRFAPAVPFTGVEVVNAGAPSFERRGYGVKIGLGKDPQKSVDLILFRGRDDPNSLDSIPTNGSFTPAENLVLGTVINYQLWKNITLEAEYAFSGYTEDTRLGEGDLQSYRFMGNFGDLFTANTSSQFNQAVNIGLKYRQDKFDLNARYRRIDPEYKTMGSAFLNNDLENITLGGSVRLLRNKVTLSANAGIERNNLADDLVSTLSRFIGSLNANVAFSPRFNVNANFQNFSSSNTFQATLLPGGTGEADSLSFTQTTTSGGLTANYRIPGEGVQQNFSLMTNYQEAIDTQGGNSRFLNANLTYQRNIKAAGLSLNGGLVFNSNEVSAIQTSMFGLSAGARKQLWDRKLRLRLTANYLNQFTDGSNVGRNLTLRSTANLRQGEHHNFSFNFSINNRASEQQDLTEFRGTVGYNYSF